MILSLSLARAGLSTLDQALIAVIVLLVAILVLAIVIAIAVLRKWFSTSESTTFWMKTRGRMRMMLRRREISAGDIEKGGRDGSSKLVGMDPKEAESEAEREISETAGAAMKRAAEGKTVNVAAAGGIVRIEKDEEGGTLMVEGGIVSVATTGVITEEDTPTAAAAATRTSRKAATDSFEIGERAGGKKEEAKAAQGRISRMRILRKRTQSKEKAVQPDSKTLKDNGFTERMGIKYIEALKKTIEFAMGDRVLSSILSSEISITFRSTAANSGTGSDESSHAGESEVRENTFIQNNEALK